MFLHAGRACMDMNTPASISESELSDVTLSVDGAVPGRSAHSRRPRRAPRKSTTYCLGYPAPRIIGKTKVVQKVFLPRLLLQLQKVTADGRSRPVLEVFPATRIAGPVVAPRLSKRFPGIFGVKRHLGYDDLVLVRRDDGDSSSDTTESENDESLEPRNLVAVYSPLRHSEEAEIVLHDGSVWVARPLANGSFDFVHTNAEGTVTTARWAHRHTAAATPTSLSTDTATCPSGSPQTRFTFSILNPSTRRHPVMATLTPSSLDVQDNYTSVSPSHARHPPITRVGRSLSVTSPPSRSRTSPYSPSKLSSLGSTSDEEDSAIGIPSSPDCEPPERTVHEIDDTTKMLISVTAFWVALRSGWSKSYNSSRTSHDTPASPGAGSQRGGRRRNTWTTRSSTSDVPRPTDLPLHNESPRARGKCYSLPAAICDSALNRSPNHTPAVSRSSTPTSLTPPAAADPRPIPRRATSTGAAFMQRHLQTSFPSPNAERDAPIFEHETAPIPTQSSKITAPAMTPAPASAPAPIPAVQVAQQQQQQQQQSSPKSLSRSKSSPKKERDKTKGSKKATKRAAAEKELAGLQTGTVRKGESVREKLLRWIHKLGSSSSSSSSR
ncbi:hypothetical protein NEMBOFW57_008511 [Staphylotrichum longicolle]|uniref:Uncharacterized protein n=1 Tax=Staphylotrichum longicolle TaxID=669026 RepID=A0AAD4ES52_9PEZI|nr:hypothetical protein NEMBOFW57_008511 [Staphylotrichum longicolle]